MSKTACLLSKGAILLLVAFLSLACTPLSTRTVVVENRGTIYFDNLENSTTLRAHASPEGCFSSSCTLPLEQSGNVKIDPQSFTLHFETRFVLRQQLRGVCTADCGGGGSVAFEIGEVEPGVYTVWLGSKRLGQLQIPFQPAMQPYLEFSTEATATPLPSPTVRAAPTEPRAYPPPEPEINPKAYPFP
jgi:hypothetical protein